MTGAGLVLGDEPLGLETIAAALNGPVEVSLHPEAVTRVEAAHRVLLQTVATDAPVYGANTGFGRLALKRIPARDLRTLQLNLVRSHAAGVGEPIPDGVVRLAMLLKLNSLAAGHSGASSRLLTLIAQCLNEELLPVVPSQGSVGASGDLAPLAHLALVFVGRGEARFRGRVMPGAAALRAAGLAPLELGPKEGLDLINGTQISVAQALAGLLDARRNMHSAIVVGALSTDAFQATDAFADPRLNALKAHPGQIAVATAQRRLLKGSAIRASHVHCDRIQDPYSFRCQPQVMGACLDLMDGAARTLLIEANAVTENPLVFEDRGDVVSGGNFHGQAVAFAADTLALAIAETGSLAERRIAALVTGELSSLPPFLMPDPGLNSGFMLAHVTAAALVSENKQLAAPASVDSIPTSANQEDHVSMSAHGSRRLARMNANAAGIIAIEWLAAATGVDLLRPLTSSAVLEEVHALLRAKVPKRTADREFAPDIVAARALIESGVLVRFASESGSRNSA
ncbi:MAG: histidine ammonia-lyase [Gammaproteobacteria bacterium]|nr:histidine ammonia-lyase [Gammaproteobacteria bacterium]